jgi:filamentous hemagglutinin
MQAEVAGGKRVKDVTKTTEPLARHLSSSADALSGIPNDLDELGRKARRDPIGTLEKTASALEFPGPGIAVGAIGFFPKTLGEIDDIAKAVPEVHMGKQGKHIVGHNNFDSRKSALTADPRELAKHAGTGVPANNVPRGQAGFKERVYFGRVIGQHVDEAGNISPTTNGMIVYDKTGSIHIVPTRPSP